MTQFQLVPSMFSWNYTYFSKGLNSTCLFLMEVWMTEGPRVNFVMRKALFKIYTWILCLSCLHEKKQVEFNPYVLYQNCPVLAMKYLFLNTQQGGIQNSRRSSRLIRHVCFTAGGPVSPRGHMKPSSTVDFGWMVAFGEHQNFPCLKLIEIVILWVYYTIPFGFSLFLALFGHYFSTFYTTCLAKDHWRGFSTRNAHMIHIVNLFR